MHVKLEVLKQLIKVSYSCYVDKASESLIFVSKDRGEIYLIQRDPEDEKTFEFMHDLQEVKLKPLAKVVKEYNEKQMTPDLWKIVDETLKRHSQPEISIDFKSRLHQVIKNLSSVFGGESTGEIMAFLPPISFLQVFNTLREIYGVYNRDVLVFRFPNTKDTLKTFTFRVNIGDGFISAMSSPIRRSMVEWR